MKTIAIASMIILMNMMAHAMPKEVLRTLNPSILVVNKVYELDGEKYVYVGSVVRPLKPNSFIEYPSSDGYVFMEKDSFISRVLYYDYEKKQWTEYC